MPGYWQMTVDVTLDGGLFRVLLDVVRRVGTRDRDADRSGS